MRNNSWRVAGRSLQMEASPATVCCCFVPELKGQSAFGADS